MKTFNLSIFDSNFFLFILKQSEKAVTPILEEILVTDNIGIFGNRFFLILGCYIFPIAVVFGSIVSNQIFRKDFFIVHRSLYKFIPYKYFLHNAAFCAFIGFFILNTLIFVYMILDIFAFDFGSIFDNLGKPKNIQRPFNKVDFFGKIIFIGYNFNLVATIVYLRYNLYSTDSIFSEGGEKKLKKGSDSKGYEKLRYSHPGIADLFYRHVLLFEKHEILDRKKFSTLF